MARPPPPPPPAALAAEARARLIAELLPLDAAELLALCAEVDVLAHGRAEHARDRLHLYLTALRAKPGTRAQFCCLVVGFDLARRGDPTAQREFAALVPVCTVLAEDPELAASLVRGDPYLARAWANCEEWLRTPHDATHGLEEGVPLAGVLPLLEGETIELDLAVPADEEPAEEVALDDVTMEPDEEVELVDDAAAVDELEEQARTDFAAALLRQMGHEVEKGRFRFGSGFETDSSGDLDRLESFARDCVPRGELVPTAAGLAWLLPIHAAAGMKKTSLFGRANHRRGRLLEEGLARWPGEMAALVGAAEVVLFEGPIARQGFARVLDAVMEYLAFCARNRLDPRAAASATRFAQGG